MSLMSVTTTPGPDTSACHERYREVRATTEALCRPLGKRELELLAERQHRGNGPLGNR